MGLLPISPDPESGLWEFAHLMTGVPAKRGADGKLKLTEQTGVVLVLLPGGTFWMGAQSDDPEGPNYEREAQRGDGPVHEVELSPFVIAKYEVTQAQWERVMGSNPSFIRDADLPVDGVSWHPGPPHSSPAGACQIGTLSSMTIRCPPLESQ